MPTELSSEEFARVHALFDHFPNDLAELDDAWNERQTRVFVDNSIRPQIALLCHRVGDCFIAGRANAELICSMINYITSTSYRPHVVFLILPGDEWRGLILESFGHCFKEVQRVANAFSTTQLNGIRTWPNRIPDGFSLKRIDAKIAERIPKELEPDFELFWENTEKFTTQGVGFVLMKDDSIISVAYSLFPPKRFLDIGIATSPKFRGFGFATFICAPLIEYCLEHNIEPHWTTQATNLASRSVARKLGFERERLHYWLQYTC